MNISEYLHRRRSELMGLAILMVLCFHSGVATPFLPVNYLFFSNGNIGVDIFALVAGFGCAFSLERDDRFGRFYARRLQRLLPPYYVALLVMLALFGCESLAMLISHIIPIGVWVGHSAAYWYISATILYYALVPPVRWLILNARRPRLMFAALLICAALLIPYAATKSGPNIAIARLPSLVTGTALGVFWHIHRTKRDWWIDCALVLGVYALGLFMVAVRKFGFVHIGWFETGMVRRLHQDLRAPLLAVALAVAFDLVERTPLRFANAALRAWGRHSLDIYMGHIIIRNAAKAYLGIEGWPLFAAMLLLSYPLALGIDWAGRRLLALAKKLPVLKARG